MAPEAILFDLFGTVVCFSDRVPRIRVGAEQRRTTLGWLEDAVATELPDVAFSDLLAAVLAVSKEIVTARAPDYHEIPSAQRFLRALDKLSAVPADRGERAALAERLVTVHMAHLASLTFLPDGHAAILEELGCRYRLGLVSNFDHGPTARRILENHGVADFFEVKVISDGFGRRKPHPAIFEHCLSRMGVSAERAVYVGDSFDDDVRGACGADLDTIWINPTGKPLPDAMVRPAHVITKLPELRSILL